MGVPTMPAHHTRTDATAPHSGTADTVVCCSAARRIVSTLSKPFSILATSSLLVICGVLGALQADELNWEGGCQVLWKADLNILESHTSFPCYLNCTRPIKHCWW